MAHPRVIGAYAAQPPEPSERPAFVAEVLRLPGCDGLEIPFGSQGYGQDQAWLWESLPPGGSHVLTLVAATMEALAGDDQFGPASGSRRGRRAFLDLLARTRDTVEASVRAGHRIVAVEIQSAPRGTARPGPGPDALRDTLALVAGWDWCGASLAVEHCDAYRPEEPFAKGFLGLADEVAVARDLRAAGAATEVGITINWGRSAIDARSATGPDAQIALTREAGVLAGVMISGTTRAEGAFGPAWSDSHAPLHDHDPRAGEPTSLLTGRLVRSALQNAGTGLRHDGVKVGVRPRDLPLARRVSLVARTLAAMESARDA